MAEAWHCGGLALWRPGTALPVVGWAWSVSTPPPGRSGAERRHALPAAGALLRPNSARRVDMAADGAVRVLAREGLVALTLRSVGAELRITPQAVRQWFGRAEAVRVAVADEVGRRWTSWLTDPYRSRTDPSRGGPERLDGAAGRDDDEVSATRAWLALCQAARDSDDIALAHRPWERQERHVVERLTTVGGRRISSDQASLVLAVVRGLRHAPLSTR